MIARIATGDPLPADDGTDPAAEALGEKGGDLRRRQAGKGFWQLRRSHDRPGRGRPREYQLASRSRLEPDPETAQAMGDVVHGEVANAVHGSDLSRTTTSWSPGPSRGDFSRGWMKLQWQVKRHLTSAQTHRTLHAAAMSAWREAVAAA